jgi:hypothetical protein
MVDKATTEYSQCTEDQLEPSHRETVCIVGIRVLRLLLDLMNHIIFLTNISKLIQAQQGLPGHDST